MFAKTHSVLHWLHMTRKGNKLLLMKGVGANFEYTEWKKLVGLGWREEIKLFLFIYLFIFTFPLSERHLQLPTPSVLFLRHWTLYKWSAGPLSYDCCFLGLDHHDCYWHPPFFEPQSILSVVYGHFRGRGSQGMPCHALTDTPRHVCLVWLLVLPRGCLWTCWRGGQNLALTKPRQLLSRGLPPPSMPQVALVQETPQTSDISAITHSAAERVCPRADCLEQLMKLLNRTWPTPDSWDKPAGWVQICQIWADQQAFRGLKGLQTSLLRIVWRRLLVAFLYGFPQVVPLDFALDFWALVVFFH